MPEVAARITIPVTTNADKANTSLKNLDKSIDKTDKSTKKAAKGFGDLSSAAKIGAVSVGVGLVAALFKVGDASVKLSSDAEETSNKFNAVFASVRDVAHIAAGEFADSFDLAASESKKLIANTGDLISGLGASGEESIKFSSQLNTLAGDLASFTNIQGGTARASEILTKAALGERDALTALGIKISEAAVQAELATKGQNKLTGAALLQARAYATLKLAQDQSKNALGDYARSSDSFANTSKKLNAQLSDLGVEIGTALLPVLKDLLSITNSVLKSFRDSATARKVEKVEIESGLKVEEFRLQKLREDIELGKLNIKTIKERGNESGRLSLEISDLAKNEEKLALAQDEVRLKQDQVTEAIKGGFTSLESYIAFNSEAAKKIRDVAKANEDATRKAKAAEDQRKKNIERWKEWKGIVETGQNVLAASGDLTAKLAVLDLNASKQRKQIAKAGLADADAMTTFERKQLDMRFAAINKFIKDSINVEGASLEEKRNLIASATNDAISASEKTRSEEIKAAKGNHVLIEEAEQAHQERMKEIKTTGSVTTQVLEKEAFMKQVDFAAQTALQVGDIFSNLAQVRQNIMQQEITDLQARQDAEIEALIASGATDEEVTAAKAANVAELDKKKKALAKKAAKEAKTFALFDIAINTARAIASVSPVVPLMIFAGITGAAQAAVVASQPVPAQFGGSFVVPPGNEADSGLLAVNQGEKVTVEPVRETDSNGGGSGGPMILQVGNESIEAWLVDAMNRNLNNGKVIIRTTGTIQES